MIQSNGMVCCIHFYNFIIISISKQEKLNNVLLQGLVLTTVLSSLYNSAVPQGISMNFAYTNNMMIAGRHKSIERIEKILTRDPEILADFCHK